MHIYVYYPLKFSRLDNIQNLLEFIQEHHLNKDT